MSFKSLLILSSAVAFGLFSSLVVLRAAANSSSPASSQTLSADSLLVSAPFEDLHGIPDAGAFNLIPGEKGTGLRPALASLWTQDILSGETETDDRFASAFAVGDFNGDGYFDVAVGNPYENCKAMGFIIAHDSGAVNVIYGTASGLSTAHQDYLIQAGIYSFGDYGEDDCGEGDHFGYSLAVGDFDGDGYDDLAIGAPGEDIDIGSVFTDTGSVDVFYGSAGGLENGRLVAYGPQGTNSQFGYAVAAGDFNCDGYDDLVIGSPHEISADGDLDVYDAGNLHVVYGSEGGVDDAFAKMKQREHTPGWIEHGEHFGSVLAVGDFNGDACDDLAVGIPDRDTPISGGSVKDAGMVAILYGNPSNGLADTSYDEHWWQDTIQDDSSNPVDPSEEDDRFGYALGVADFDQDGYDDLLVGTPYEYDLWYGYAGAVQLLKGQGTTPPTLSPTQDIWEGDSANEYLGWRIATGDFNGDGYPDFALGLPGFDSPRILSIHDIGAVKVYYRSNGTFTSGTRITSDEIPGNSAEDGDQLGWALGVLPAPLEHIYLPLVVK